VHRHCYASLAEATSVAGTAQRTDQRPLPPGVSRRGGDDVRASIKLASPIKSAMKA